MKQFTILSVVMLLFSACVEKQNEPIGDYVRFEPKLLLSEVLDEQATSATYKKLIDSLRKYKVTESKILRDTLQFINVIDVDDEFYVMPRYQVVFTAGSVNLTLAHIDEGWPNGELRLSVDSIPKIVEGLVNEDLQRVTNKIQKLISNAKLGLYSDVLSKVHFTKSPIIFDTYIPNTDLDILRKNLKEEFLINIPTLKARVSGDLENEFVLSVDEWQRECGVRFNIITTLKKNKFHSYITDIKYDNKDICPYNFSVIELYIDDVKQRLKHILDKYLDTLVSITLPENFEEYFQLTADYVQSGGKYPYSQIDYNMEQLQLSGDKEKRLSNLAEYVANKVWIYSEPICVTNFEVVNSTAYVEFDIHKNGFMGVSVWLARIEPLVKRNLMRNNRLLKDVVFNAQPESS